MRLDVSADCLAAFMVLDRKLEVVPEPFRMQPDVQMVINFEEYLKFVQSLPIDKMLLYSPTHRICEAIAIQNESALLRSFYVDMALAVCKELFFAELSGKKATVIRHAFYDCTASKEIVVEDSTVLLLKHILAEKRFEPSAPISGSNIVHWNYACKLTQDAVKAPTRWVEKI